MAAPLPLPLSLSELERIRLRANKRLETSGTGSIMRRRMGQSLEYREHRNYNYGDDVRHIDWRASARLGRPNEYLVRGYEAEEQFNLLVAVDLRATMRLPDAVSKLQIALWQMEALAQIARRQKLRIGFVPLYGTVDRWRGFSQGGAIEGACTRALAEFWRRDATSANEVLNASAAVKALPQSSATLVITDLYMDNPGPLIEWCRRVRGGYRQLILCELDTWPTERRLLEGQMVRLGAVGPATSPEGEFEPSTTELDAAASAIAERRRDVATALRLRNLEATRWTAPADLTAETAQQSFHGWFSSFVWNSELFARRG